MRTITGIQPTNILHLGNYFGAIEPALKLQDSSELLMMIVDLHAITIQQDPKILRSNILFLAATYLAAGVDPSRTILFQQSTVSAHAELGWLLQTVCRMGEAERMTQFKDKSTSKGENVSVGLFTYPILMAADILLYDVATVPVGADQKQHVELARDLAERFNRDFGQTFIVPKPAIRSAGARLMSLIDPTKKMSKSDPNAKAYISLMDEPEVVAKKIAGAVTDSDPRITLDPARPGLFNLLTIFSLVTGTSALDLAHKYENQGAKALKTDLAAAIVDFLHPLQTKINSHLADETALIDLISQGDSRAQAIANIKLKQAKQNMGLSLT